MIALSLFCGFSSQAFHSYSTVDCSSNKSDAFCASQPGVAPNSCCAKLSLVNNQTKAETVVGYQCVPSEVAYDIGKYYSYALYKEDKYLTYQCISTSFTNEAAIGIDFCDGDGDCFSDECCADRMVSVNGGWTKVFRNKVCTPKGQDEDGFVCKPKGSIANYTIDYARFCQSEFESQDFSVNQTNG